MYVQIHCTILYIYNSIYLYKKKKIEQKTAEVSFRNFSAQCDFSEIQFCMKLNLQK